MTEHGLEAGEPLQAARGLNALSDRPAAHAAGGCACGGSCGGACPTCTANASERAVMNVYAIGQIRANIPNLGMEKEMAQTGLEFKHGLSDEEALVKLLRDPQHRRLAHEMCWTFAVEDVDLFIIKPSGDFALSLILDALKPDKAWGNVDVLIGRMGDRASMSECNGRPLPVVVPSQVSSLDREALLGALETPKDLAAEALSSAIKQTLDITLRIGANYGLSAAHRAINYAVTRSAELYVTVAHELLGNWALVGLTSRPSAVSAGRTVVDTILQFRNRKTDAVKRCFMKIDVTDLYPFMVSPIHPFLDFN